MAVITWIEGVDRPLEEALWRELRDATVEVGFGRIQRQDAASASRGEAPTGWAFLEEHARASSFVTTVFEPAYDQIDSCGVSVSVWMRSPGRVRALEIWAPVDAFHREYSEAEVDHCRRLENLAFDLFDRFRAESLSAAGKHTPENEWFGADSASRRPIRQLPLEDCFGFDPLGTPHFASWTASPGVTLRRWPSGGAELADDSSGVICLLTRCPVCGGRLPGAEPLEEERDVATTERWRRALWTVDSPAELERRYGPADRRLPGWTLPEEEKVEGLAWDLDEVRVYDRLEPGASLLIRSTGDGRLSAIVAGHVNAAPNRR